MPDAAALQSQVTQAQQQLAIADLSTLQAFQTLILNPQSTIGQLQAGMVALQAGLGDPQRQTQVKTWASVYQGMVDTLATLVNDANAIANPGLAVS